MATFSLIRGWLECSFGDAGRIKRVVDEHWEGYAGYGLREEQAALYKQGWVFPAAPINYVSLVFYGCNVNQGATQFLKDCFVKIATMGAEVCGTLYVDDEEEEDVRQWILNEGTFQDVERSVTVRPRFID